MKKTPSASNADENVITVKPGHARPLSPHHRIIQATGEELIRRSHVTGQEFCKFMIRICIGAIPVYIALLSLANRVEKAPGWYTVLATIPALFYLAAMVLFTAGYQPVSGHFSVHVIEEIEAFREKTMRKRNAWAKAGFSVFVVATLWASVIIITGTIVN